MQRTSECLGVRYPSCGQLEFVRKRAYCRLAFVMLSRPVWLQIGMSHSTPENLASCGAFVADALIVHPPLRCSAASAEKGVCNAMVSGRTCGCWRACIYTHAVSYLSAWGRVRSQVYSPFPKVSFQSCSSHPPRLYSLAPRSWGHCFKCSPIWVGDPCCVVGLRSASSPSQKFAQSSCPPPHPPPRYGTNVSRVPSAFVQAGLPCCLALSFYSAPLEYVPSCCLVAWFLLDVFPALVACVLYRSRPPSCCIFFCPLHGFVRA